MGGRFVFVPDVADPPSVEHMELFAGVKDVSSVPEVAEAFGVCPQTIRRLVASGELASIHVGRAVRITKQAMIEFVQAQEVKA